MVLSIIDSIIIRKPYFVNVINDKFFPLFEAIPAATTFAEAPIRVPLPPKQAPRERGHHKAYLIICNGISGCAKEMLGINPVFIIGIRVAV